MVEMIRRLDLALHNPIWQQVRTPAPWLAAEASTLRSPDAAQRNPGSSGVTARIQATA
jgi:nitrogenase molybdenum-cofactor synthesis protein NifE